LESTITLVDSFHTEHLKIVFDAYHFGHDRSVLANLKEIVPYTALVQLGDRLTAHNIDHDRCQLGRGIVPLPEVICSLMEAGYTGDFDVELVGQDIEPSDYETLLSTSRHVFDELLSPILGR